MHMPRLRAVPPEPGAAPSPLGTLRVRRRMTVEEAAARARLRTDDVRSLEEGRIYRFPSVHEAIAAAIVYANALGIRDREARELAGLPPGRRSLWSLRRWVAVAAFALMAGALVWFAVVPELRGDGDDRTAIVDAQRSLPPPWEIRVDVFNGTTLPNAATVLANEVGGPLAYRIGTVENADRLDYIQTRVYYPPGSEDIAERLARELDVPATALPSEGGEPNRLIVIVGRDRARSP